MAEPIIKFEGSDKLRVDAPYPVLLKASTIQGVHVDKRKTCVRATKDEMTCYYLMKEIGAKPSPEVLQWLQECKAHRNTLAHILSKPHELQLNKLSLYPFQTSDVRFMIHAKRCINANEPGIGKTIEGIAASDIVEATSILVVCQKSLMYYWADEFRKWSYGDVVVCEESSSYKKQEKLRAKINADARIKIISYSLLDEKKWPELFKYHWQVIIADEAHYLKNHDSGRSQAFARLRSTYLWLLTGTPDPNGRVGELYGLLHLIDPGRFKSYWDFCYRFGIVDEQEVYIARDQKIKNKQVQGVRPEVKEVFHRMITPYMFVRKKSEVYKDLPEKIYQRIPLELSAGERKLYNTLMKEMVLQVSKGDWLVTKNAMHLNSTLRQLLLDPALIGSDIASTKTNALLEFIEDTPGQIVVFTWFRTYTALLEEVFNKNGIKALRIDGSTTAEEVQLRSRLFQTDPSYRVIFGTISKMSEGQNYQNAQALVFMDKSYVPKDNFQAENRIHRPGQTQRPIIASFVARNTIDEDIEDILATKQNSIDEIETFQYLLNKLRQSVV